MSDNQTLRKVVKWGKCITLGAQISPTLSINPTPGWMIDGYLDNGEGLLIVIQHVLYKHHH